MVEGNPDYSETANQKNQIAQLFAKHNDVIVLDRWIFIHHLNLLHYFPNAIVKGISFKQPVFFHKLFEPSLFKIAFSSRKVRDSFNNGLKQLKDSGRYQQIMALYVKE